ncbi:hypothetical protein Leryth_007233 [Lithospermum erythrorhizon]|nr:hypothetical protein Leryth_007233 [Lithospermum erythrorhizon]
MRKALFGSPFIIQGFGGDVSIEKGQKTYNLMMEYASGGTLRGLIKQKGGRMHEAEVACYTAMLLQGLSCVHEKGIVHCDMKPDNILVFPMKERDGILNHHLVKIADFGLAKKIWEKDMIDEPGRASSNRGALLYASPESIRTEQELINKVTLERPEIPDYVSEIARDFLEKCLERQLHKRWTTRRLLRHPFIANNARHFRITDHLLRSNNPFGSDMIREQFTFFR